MAHTGWKPYADTDWETWSYWKSDQNGDAVNGCFGDGVSNITDVDRCDGCSGYDTQFGLPKWVNGVIAAKVIMVVTSYIAWGTVPEQNLVGQAFFIWMSWDIAGGQFNFSRIGSTIE